jgi:hypothetical protein
VAHQGLKFGALLLVACGAAGVPVESADLGARPRGAGGGPGGWGVRKAPRAHVAVTLPDAQAWTIDDAGGDLVGVHAATAARLVVKHTAEREVVGRAQCEARARAMGLVPDGKRTREVDAANIVGPGDMDTRVVVAVDPGEGEGAPVTGWVLAFGGHLRRCLIVRYETKVASAREEAELSARLAAVRARVVPEIALEPVLDPVLGPRSLSKPR